MGVNHRTIHGFSSSPINTPPPGDVYFAGTHFNPGVTWWNSFAQPLTSFFNRSQTMLTTGYSRDRSALPRRTGATRS